MIIVRSRCGFGSGPWSRFPTGIAALKLRCGDFGGELERFSGQHFLIRILLSRRLPRTTNFHTQPMKSLEALCASVRLPAQVRLHRDRRMSDMTAEEEAAYCVC
jgi:hypothetical protein